MVRPCGKAGKQREAEGRKESNSTGRASRRRVLLITVRRTVVARYSMYSLQVPSLKCPSVSLPPSQNQISKNISCKLHNRHPTPCRDLNHPNDQYLAALDPTLPDPPSTTSWVDTLWVRLASLVGENKSQYTMFPYCSGSEGLDLEKGVYRSPYVMCNLRNGDGITLPRFVAN